MPQTVTTADLRRELDNIFDAIRKDTKVSTDSLADKFASVLENFIDTRIERAANAGKNVEDTSNVAAAGTGV